MPGFWFLFNNAIYLSDSVSAPAGLRPLQLVPGYAIFEFYLHNAIKIGITISYFSDIFGISFWLTTNNFQLDFTLMDFYFLEDRREFFSDPVNVQDSLIIECHKAT